MIIYIVTVTTDPQEGSVNKFVTTNQELAHKYYDKEIKKGLWARNNLDIERWDTETGEQLYYV